MAKLEAAHVVSAREAHDLLRSPNDGRRENVESIEALRKRGAKINPLPKEAEADWDKIVEEAWPKIRGTVVPTDIFDQVMTDLKAFRAKQGAAK